MEIITNKLTKTREYVAIELTLYKSSKKIIIGNHTKLLKNCVIVVAYFLVMLQFRIKKNNTLQKPLNATLGIVFHTFINHVSRNIGFCTIIINIYYMWNLILTDARCDFSTQMCFIKSL